MTPSRGGVKTRAGQMPWAASPWIIGAVSIYALPGSEEGAAILFVWMKVEERNPLIHGLMPVLSHVHSGRTLGQITGLCHRLRPWKGARVKFLGLKKKSVLERRARFLCHRSAHRSAKEAWPNPCDCDFMDKHLSSAPLELGCHHERVGGKCPHQSLRKSRNSNILPDLTQNSERL